MKADILRLAVQKHLRAPLDMDYNSGKSRYLCLAIAYSQGFTALQEVEGGTDAYKIIEDILVELEYNVTVERYLIKTGRSYDVPSLYEFRKELANKLIAKYEAEEAAK